MVESRGRNGASGAALVNFESAVDVAILTEVTKAELQTVLDTKYPETAPQIATNGHAVIDYCESPEGRFALPDDVPIFTELHEGLITVPDAARRYNVRPRTVQDWVAKGRVQLRGRLKAGTKGGGYLVVNEEELVAYISAPRDRGGRPRKPSE